jgi:hypothetical protein
MCSHGRHHGSGAPPGYDLLEEIGCVGMGAVYRAPARGAEPPRGKPAKASKPG